MSDVFSFRLSDENPREAQAREVIDAWVKQGYSLRQVLTAALLLLGKRERSSTQANEMAEIVDRLARLVDKLEENNGMIPVNKPAKSELSTTFEASIKTAVKPGMRINKE